MRNVLFRFARLGGLVVAMIALGAVAAAGSASAATQHWASSTQLPFGSSTEVSGEAPERETYLEFYVGSTEVEISCSGLSASGSLENPVSGGSGALGDKGFELTGCETNIPACALKEEAIPFGSLSSSTYANSGGDWIEYKPPGFESDVAVLTLVNKHNNTCQWGPTWYVKGKGFSARALPGSPGEYQISPENVHLSVFGEPVSMNSHFNLTQSSSGKKMVLSSAASPGSPHWYLDSANWSNLSAGKSATYASYGPMTFDLVSEFAGIGVEVSCSGTSNSIGGSLENPTGGGAGTASASLSLGGCTMPYWEAHGCVLHQPVQWSLSGTATEIGTTRAVEFQLPSGSKHLSFTIEAKKGEKCLLPTAYPVEGRLIATSEGDGHFGLAASEVTAYGEEATLSGRFALENPAGESLRLQP